LVLVELIRDRIHDHLKQPRPFFLELVVAKLLYKLLYELILNNDQQPLSL